MIVPPPIGHNPLVLPTEVNPLQTGVDSPARAAQTAHVADEIVGGTGRELGEPWLPAARPGQPAAAPRWRSSRLALLVLVGMLFGYVGTHRYPAPDSGAELLLGTSTPVRLLPWLGGHPGLGPAGLRLLVDAPTPHLVDTGSGRVLPLPGIRLEPDSVITAFVLGPVGPVAVAEPYGSDGGRYLFRAGAGPVLLGADPIVGPGRDGQLILTVARSGDTTVTGLSVDRVVGWQWKLPGVVFVLRDTAAGVLVAQYAGPDSAAGTLLLVDRGSGRTLRRLGFGSPVASTDRQLAWLPGDCADRCSVVVDDLAAAPAREARFALPDGWTPTRGAFSPDGRALAMTFPTLVGGSPRPGFIATLDLRLGALTRVPDVRTGSGLDADVGWSPDGRWLVLVVDWPDLQRIALWRPGDLRVLPVTLTGRPGRLTVLS